MAQIIISDASVHSALRPFSNEWEKLRARQSSMVVKNSEKISVFINFQVKEYKRIFVWKKIIKIFSILQLNGSDKLKIREFISVKGI